MRRILTTFSRGIVTFCALSAPLCTEARQFLPADVCYQMKLQKRQEIVQTEIAPFLGIAKKVIETANRELPSTHEYASLSEDQAPQLNEKIGQISEKVLSLAGFKVIKERMVLVKAYTPSRKEIESYDSSTVFGRLIEHPGPGLVSIYQGYIAAMASGIPIPQLYLIEITKRHPLEIIRSGDIQTEFQNSYSTTGPNGIHQVSLSFLIHEIAEPPFKPDIQITFVHDKKLYRAFRIAQFLNEVYPDCPPLTTQEDKRMEIVVTGLGDG